MSMTRITNGLMRTMKRWVLRVRETAEGGFIIDRICLETSGVVSTVGKEHQLHQRGVQFG
jgi:hypothetical protein